MPNRDPLNIAFVGKHKGTGTDIYKFEEESEVLDLGDEVTWNFGSDSTTPQSASIRYIYLGEGTEEANKVIMRVKNNQAAITEINGAVLMSPILIFPGAPFTDNFGKPISQMKVMFDEDDTIVEIIGVA